KECSLLGLAHRVLVERCVLSLDTRIPYGGIRRGADVRKAATVTRRACRTVRCARWNVLVIPAGLVVQLVVLPEDPGNGAPAPFIGSAQAEFVLLMRITLVREPRRTGREAGGCQIGVVARSGAITLVVVRVDAARVVGVVTDLLHFANEVTTGIDGSKESELAVHRPGGALELVFVERVVEECNLQRL